MEHRANEGAGFIAMQAVARVDAKTVSPFHHRMVDELQL